MITDFRLELFVAVARELSFTRVAEEMSISQPAVSKHIKELERLVSAPLFRRMGSRIALTEAGERLLPLVESVLAEYSKLSDAMMVESGDFVGRLRIGASSTITQYILPDILARFRRAYPSINITLRSGNSEDILEGVSRGDIDLAMVEGAHTLSTFHYDHFRGDRVVLVTANGTLSKIDSERLKRLPLVLRESGSGTLDVIERELHRHNISRRELNVEIQIGSSEGIIRYLKASSCYAFLSEAVVGDYVSRGELKIADIEGVEINRSLRFASLQGETSRLSETFKTFCLDSIKQSL